MNERSFILCSMTQNPTQPPAIDRRAAIMAAALELFARRGFEGTSVDVIVKRAGVAAGTVYRYFASKEALVNELFQHWERARVEAIFFDYPWRADPRGQFRLYWQRLATFARQNPSAYVFLEMHWHTPYLDEASRDLRDQCIARGDETLGSMREKGAVKDIEPHLIMSLVSGVFNGLFQDSLNGFIELSDSIVATAEDCCWDAIKRSDWMESPSARDKERRGQG